MTITWALLADFDRDGTFSQDLTAYVTKPGNGIAISRGMGPDGLIEVSKLSVTLNNGDGRFTANNSSSPYYGQMDPGVPVRVTAAHNANDYTLWTGYAQSWEREWRTGDVPMVTVDCWDLAHYLIEAPSVNVAVATDRDTDGALVAIMDALGLSAADRDFEDGLQALPVHYVAGQEAMEAMMAVVRSEMGGHLWTNASGQLRFESRATRLGIGSVDDTWGDGTSIFPVGISDLTDDMDYVTTVRVKSTVYAVGDTTEIWRMESRGDHQSTANSIALGANDAYEREFTPSLAVNAITTPVSSTDYAANSAANGSGTDRTANLTVTVTALGGGRFRLRLTNSFAGTIYVTKLRLRGTSVGVYADQPEAVVTLTRADRPAGKKVEAELPFAGDGLYQPLDWACTLLRAYRYSNQRISMTHIPDTTSYIDKMLSLELGQLIKFKDTGLGTAASYSDDWYRVAAIGQHIPPDWAGESFITEVTLEPSHIYRNLDAIAFDFFNRADAAGSLGISTNGVDWTGDSGFDISANQAVPGGNSLSIATIDLGVGVADMVVEATFA